MLTWRHVRLAILILSATIADAAVEGTAAQDRTNPAQNVTPNINSGNRKEFPDFSSLRSEVLSMIGGATKRVWLATDFLSDAEIVSSLYIAQYRKVNISVLLGRDRATNILSRLNYLKQVNIPVALRPKNFFPKYASILLIDNQLYGLTAPLDYMNKAPKPAVEPLAADQLLTFEPAFIEAAKLLNAPNMAPLPQVGRSRPNGRYYKPNTMVTQPAGSAEGGPNLKSTAGERHLDRATKSPETASTLIDSTNTEKNPDASERRPTGEGAYRYKARRDKPSEGVPTRLPRTTIRQELERERQRLREREQSTPSTAE